MPDNNGIYTLVPGYLAQAGQTIKVSQHNPVLEDIADAFNRRLMRDGATPMTGDLPMGGNKITGLADPSAAQDGATKAYVDGEVTGLSNSLGTAATVDHGTDPGEVPLNSDIETKFVKTADKASQAQAEGGVTGDVWMDDIRVRQAIAQWAIGVGQTWVDVTGNRLSTNPTTWYQNTTGRTIVMAASIDVAQGANGIRVGTAPSNAEAPLVTGGWGNGQQTHVAIVPPGHYYGHSVGNGGTVLRWAELR